MSVYQNQTNVSPGTSYFALAGSGGGSASDWSQYPAISTISYSSGGGVANLTTVNALTAVSTLQLSAANLNVSSINSAVYPPAASAPIVGTLPIPADSTTVTTETIAGITASSVIIGTLTSSSACQIVTLTPGSNVFTIDVTPGAPSATRFNYVIYPTAT